jgi:diguanylate cyclase (GGDEF)-like protein
MVSKAGKSLPIMAAFLWTTALLVVQWLPLGGSAALWRLRTIIFLAWSLGMTILWIWFRGSLLSRTGGSGAYKIADTVDPITGLPSRSFFREMAQKCMDSCGREDERGLVALFCVRDLDKIAEIYGDEEAEKVMAHVSRALFDSFRGGDILGRHDKDELAAFLPGACSRSWEAISERIHLNVADQNSRLIKPYTILVSAGRCEFDPASPSSMDILLRLAYEEMIKDMGKEQK